MPHRHHRHRTMRLRKHRPTTSSTTPTSLDPISVPLQTLRPHQSSASDSESSTHKQSDSEPTAAASSSDVPEQTLEERHRQAQDAKKLTKARLFLNSEVRHASIHANSLQPTDPVIPPHVASVTSETGSYLARLSAQAEQASSSKRKKDQRRGPENDDSDDDSIYERHHHRVRPCAHGIVRRMAEKHQRKMDKREKRRRMERLRRIAALDPLKEGERERGQAKETTFMALIRKYGSMAQQDARRTNSTNASPATEHVQQTTTDTTPTSETSSLDEHSAYLVDTLDVVDPGVSAAGHLSNIGNSLIFPNIPALYDRRPVIDLPAQQVDPDATTTEATLQLEEGLLPPTSGAITAQDQVDLHLDAYVHELLTKKQKFKRAMQGIWAFLKTPIGVIAGIYGFLVVFGGAALVLFLVGAIDGGKNKDFWVEVFSQFENGLFTIPGVGLIYWRVRDTWRMVWIAYYQHLTWQLRKKQGLPRLADKNDVPSLAAKLHKKKKKGASQPVKDDNDDSSSDEDETTPELSSEAVLTPHQAQHMHTLQTAFAESQSWYRPHETFTHHAFPISLALWITICSDLNSLFQCLLCGYMWGYATHYRDRPAWSTGTFMPCSFLAGIGAAVLIWKGGERSKKKREVEEKLLAAFARDVDAQVEAMRREAKPQTTGGGVSGVLAAVDEDTARQAEKVHAEELDSLAKKIAQEKDS